MNSADVLKSLQKAVEEVVNVYLTKTPVLLKSQSAGKENPKLKDVSVVIGLTSEEVEGVFVVSYDKEIIFEFVKNVLGEEKSEITEEVVDASGEITNQMCGVFRREFEKTGITLRGTPPSIVTGKNHMITLPDNVPRTSFLFKIDNDKNLIVEFGLAKK